MKYFLLFLLFISSNCFAQQKNNFKAKKTTLSNNKALTNTLSNSLQNTKTVYDFSGQWTGYFNGEFGDETKYIIELEPKDGFYAGVSYTYFSYGGYSICDVVCMPMGSNGIRIMEKKETKTNRNAGASYLQEHDVVFTSKTSQDVLEGTWKKSPYEKSTVNEVGTVVLVKNKIVRTSSIRPKTKPAVTQRATVQKTVNKKPKNITTAPEVVVKKIDKPKVVITKPEPIKKPTVDAIVKAPAKEKVEVVTPKISTATTINIPKPVGVAAEKLENRTKNILKSIEVTLPKIEVSLYDNGEVDGDVITVIYNNKIVVDKQTLSTKPIVLNLTVDANFDANELVMFAENQGTIPPNTALMVVTSGDQRYEVRISSDDKKSGTVRFSLKK